MNNIDEFFSSYNDVMANVYEYTLKESEKSIKKGIPYNRENLQKNIKKAADIWEREALKELGGKNPAEFLETRGTLQELLEMFNRAPIVCDDELPVIYTEKLRSFGDAAVDAMLALAGNDRMINAEDDVFLIPLNAVKLLGEWKIASAVPCLINILDMRGENFDIFAGQVKDSLISIGYPALQFILRSIEQKDINDEAVEYLLMALAEAGRDNKSESIYKCLKNAFRAMDEKAIGALCLKAYGDGRAITALRGYLEKNGTELERDTYYEIVSAIKALGGNIEGL